MNVCGDFEERLGLKIGNIKMVIPENSNYRKDGLKLTIEKRTRGGVNSLELTVHGKSYGDKRVYESMELSWDCVDAMMQWLSNGGRRMSNTKTSNNADTLKRNMRDIRMAASLFKSGFKRLQTALDNAELEAEVEKENTFPEASKRKMDF